MSLDISEYQTTIYYCTRNKLYTNLTGEKVLMFQITQMINYEKIKIDLRRSIILRRDHLGMPVLPLVIPRSRRPEFVNLCFDIQH
jgi:hypothetical protein